MSAGRVKDVISDAKIREYRGTLFGRAYDYDRWLTCQIALGNREPSRRMSRGQARSLVKEWIAKGRP